MIVRFDETDRRILRILQDDGRITMKKLAEQVHLSAPAATDRVKRLEDAGIISGYVAKVNPSAMGFKIDASIVVMYHRGKKAEFLDFLQEEDEIVQADETPGKSDAILRVHCQDIEHFFSLVSRIRVYGETDSYIHMECYKQAPLLPFLTPNPGEK